MCGFIVTLLHWRQQALQFFSINLRTLQYKAATYKTHFWSLDETKPIASKVTHFKSDVHGDGVSSRRREAVQGRVKRQ
jgi:hypothetical protein